MRISHPCFLPVIEKTVIPSQYLPSLLGISCTDKSIGLKFKDSNCYDMSSCHCLFFFFFHGTTAISAQRRKRKGGYACNSGFFRCIQLLLKVIAPTEHYILLSFSDEDSKMDKLG